MKKIQFIPLVTALVFLIGSAPASAFSLDASVKTNTNVYADRSKDGDNKNRGNDTDRKDDNGKRDERWNKWMFHSGISGTVTAKSSDSLTITSRNNASYTVDIDDAKIRYVGDNNTSLEVGDMVFVQGVVNGSSVVASVIVDTKAKTAPQPNDDERRAGIAGTITAKNSTTITVIGKNGTSYSVVTADAKVWKNKNETSSVSNLSVGDTVIVQGSMNGSTVTAAKIYAVSIPEDSSDGSVRGTVTAVNGDTITILASGGATYTVKTDDADFKDHKNENADIDDIKVGESILVKGDVNGSTIEADTVTETSIKTGWIQRFGHFWKNLFGKKGAELKMEGTVKN